MEDRGPSLADQARGAIRRWSWPATYAPALAVLAAIPGITAMLAAGLALGESHRNAALLRAEAPRLAALATARHNAEVRAAMAPYYATPPLTRMLVQVAALLPGDATLHAIARDAHGVVRLEVDGADPDTLVGAFRSAGWRSIAQSVTTGSGVRVTLEARAR